jgi:sodium/proline symporter
MNKPVEFSIFVLYLAACIVIALYFLKKSSKGESAFWGAERSVGSFVNGVALFATLISTGSFLGFVGLSYRLGWSLTTMAMGTGASLGFILNMLLSGGAMRRYSELKGKFAMSGFFADRYNVPTALAATLVVVVLYPFYIIAELIGAGLALQFLFGMHFSYAVVITGVVLGGYVLLGGMLSVTWNDFMQGILKFGVIVGLSLLAIYHFGAAPMFDKARVANPFFLLLNPRVSPWTYMGLSLGVGAFIMSSPHLVMRLFAAKNAATARKGLALTAFLIFVFHVVGYLGVAGAALTIAPKLARIDQVVFVTMDALFPPILKGLAIAGIMAAAMSTTSGMLLAIGAEFSSNIYKRFLDRDATQLQSLRVGKIVIVVVIVLTTVTAMFQTQSIGVIVALTLEGVASAFVIPLVLGLWWKRANGVGGFLGVVGGFVSFAIVHFAFHVPQFAEALFSIPISFLGLLIGSLLTAPPKHETIEFLEAIHGQQPKLQQLPAQAGQA